MYLEKFRWGPWTDGEELFNALQRGFLPAAYEYLYLTGNKDDLKQKILRTLNLPLERRVRRRLLWLLRIVDRVWFEDRGDGWIMVRIPGKVIGWLRR